MSAPITLNECVSAQVLLIQSDAGAQEEMQLKLQELSYSGTLLACLPRRLPAQKWLSRDCLLQSHCHPYELGPNCDSTLLRPARVVI